MRPPGHATPRHAAERSRALTTRPPATELLWVWVSPLFLVGHGPHASQAPAGHSHPRSACRPGRGSTLQGLLGAQAHPGVSGPSRPPAQVPWGVGPAASLPQAHSVPCLWAASGWEAQEAPPSAAAQTRAAFIPSETGPGGLHVRTLGAREQLGVLVRGHLCEADMGWEDRPAYLPHVWPAWPLGATPRGWQGAAVPRATLSLGVA